MLFCNWLSRKEGRTPCYERTGKKEKVKFGKSEYERDVWRVVADATGYRLPTEAEWEYACRAGTTTEYASGGDEETLRKYAVCQASHAASCGSKLPNGWGLFDMHGNVWEWCWDGYLKLDVNPQAGDTDWTRAPVRWFRGGKLRDTADGGEAWFRSGHSTEYRYHSLGFRVARGQSGASESVAHSSSGGAERSEENLAGFSPVIDRPLSSERKVAPVPLPRDPSRDRRRHQHGQVFCNSSEYIARASPTRLQCDVQQGSS